MRMVNQFACWAIALLTLVAASPVMAAEKTAKAEKPSLFGTYMEARTCQVYTGPCFANGEMGLTGNDAIMAWAIEKGSHNGVKLDGLKVILVINSEKTLGHYGIEDAGKVKSVILVDEKASDAQHEALVNLASEKAGKAGQNVVRVDRSPIDMELDRSDLTANLQAGKKVKLVTRKARKGDCICSNESAFYPPLAQVSSFVPGVAIDGSFKGRGLGSTWDIPGSRSAYMGLFEY